MFATFLGKCIPYVSRSTAGMVLGTLQKAASMFRGIQDYEMKAIPGKYYSLVTSSEKSA